MPDAPTEEQDTVSDRTRSAAVPLAVLLGCLGAHRFYVGKTSSAILMACTLGGMGLWWMADVILLLTGEFRDADGRRVVKWSADSPARPARLATPQIESMRDEMDQMRSEMTELAERVDFMERMLAKVRERDAIPPGAR